MTHFNVGDFVQDRNDSTRTGTVTNIYPLEGGAQYYKVLWPHPFGLTSVLEEDIQSFTPERGPQSDFLDSNFSGYEEFLRLVTVNRLSKGQPLKNTLYAFNASRTCFYPYQFKPLVKFLDSEKYRVLICDEVGLGKTIEAGLILTEFKARFAANRILVVCPSGLREKWRTELKKRFDEDFRIFGSRDFMELLEQYEEMPERVKINGIVSLETIRSKNILSRMKAVSPDFDMVIVDEAHHLRNPGNKQWQAGTLLSENSTAMVMLTATPVQLGRENLFTLLKILDSQEFPEKHGAEERFRINENIVMAQNAISRNPPSLPEAQKFLEKAGRYSIIRENPYYPLARMSLEALSQEMESCEEEDVRIKSLIDAQRVLASLNLISHIYTRTRRREVHENFTRRQAHPIQVEFTPREKEFYRSVTQFVRAKCAAAGYPSVVEKWVLNMPQRQMASSIPAMVEYYREKLLSESPSFRRNIVKLEELDDLENERQDLRLESDENGSEMEDEIPSYEEALETLRTIVALWPENGPDSKYDAFIRAVRDVRAKEKQAKILVFSFFKGTLRYLKKRLAAEGIRTVSIHGDIRGEERQTLINAFREDPSVEIMLSSKVGSEGLDFQFSHVLFNYDLPWNPMEVEQRIGRLDRIGQESPFIAIYHFWITGTIEERILKRLYERIGVFERSIGELELILGEISRELEYELFSRELTPEEEMEALERKLRVLKSREEDLQRIESDAARFIGTDVFFAHEVEKVRKNRLYITPDQIRSLVENFFRNHTPQTRFEYDPLNEAGRLFPGQDLLEALAKEGCLRDFNALGIHGKVREITFSGDVAFTRPGLEFINILHPVTRAIIGFYKKESFLSSACHFIRLGTDRLPGGFYFFFAYIVEVKAARDEYRMQVAIINDHGEEACDPEDSEYIFGEILEKGSSSETPAPEFEREDLKEVHEKAESVIRKRVSVLRKDMAVANEVFVDRRIQAIESFYDRIINQKKERLENEERKNSPDEKIKRLLRGDIRNREAEKKSDIQKVEERRRLSVEFRLLCLGCLEIGSF